MTSLDPAQRSGPRFLSSIAGKITLRMLFVAAIPVLAVGALTVGSLFALANRANQRLESNQANLTAETIGATRADQSRLVLARMRSFVDERVSDVIDWSRSEVLIEAVTADYPELDSVAGLETSVIDSQFDANYRLDASGRSNRWLRAQVGDQSAYTNALITNARGLTVGSANPSIDFTNSDQDWWTLAWDNGAHLDAARIDEESGSVVFDLAVRIDDPTTGRPLGVLRTTVDTAVLQPFADEFANESDGLEVSVATASGLLLAETASEHDPSRITVDLPFGSPDAQTFAENLVSDQTDVLLAEDQLGGFTRTAESLTIPRLGITVDNHDWIAVVQQPSSAALQPLEGLESLSNDLDSTARFLTIVIAALVLAALLLAFLLARLLAKRIARPINQLRVEANNLADRELPQLVKTLEGAELTNEVPTVLPIDIDADGEVAELASAFNSVRSTAVGLATEQAVARTKDVSNILLNLGRRNQQLVGRQLRFIDDLERSESDPDTLRSLFTLDQMATRMRRNAESLIVLAGEDSPRRVSEPKPIEEVLRAASGEVEDYARVRLASTDSTLIRPLVVNDLTHLLAELIENATNFSPPDEMIDVVGAADPSGFYTVSVIDRGVGIPSDRLDEANLQLSDPTASGDSTSSFLGLSVVSRLAARHNISVRLVESATVGITAKVTLSPECVANIPAPVNDVTGSRLSQSENTATRSDSSWPPPKVEYSPPAPEAQSTAEEWPAPDPQPAAMFDDPAATVPPVLPTPPARGSLFGTRASADQTISSPTDETEQSLSKPTITPPVAPVPRLPEPTQAVVSEDEALPAAPADVPEPLSSLLPPRRDPEGLDLPIETPTDPSADTPVDALAGTSPPVVDPTDTPTDTPVDAFAETNPPVVDPIDTSTDTPVDALAETNPPVVDPIDTSTDTPVDALAETNPPVVDPIDALAEMGPPVVDPVDGSPTDTANAPIVPQPTPDAPEPSTDLYAASGTEITDTPFASESATPAEARFGPEDETEGLPIPPFRARESKRVPEVPPLAGTPPDAAATNRGDSTRRSMFQVRRRIRNSDITGKKSLEPVTSPGAGDDGSGRSRAEEVRDKLTRFATGVEAARKGGTSANDIDQGGHGAASGTAGHDTDLTDADAAKTNPDGIDSSDSGEPSGSGHEAVTD